jgi:hypothetical protein
MSLIKQEAIQYFGHYMSKVGIMYTNYDFVSKSEFSIVL